MGFCPRVAHVMRRHRAAMPNRLARMGFWLLAKREVDIRNRREV